MSTHHDREEWYTCSVKECAADRLTLSYTIHDREHRPELEQAIITAAGDFSQDNRWLLINSQLSNITQQGFDITFTGNKVTIGKIEIAKPLDGTLIREFSSTLKNEGVITGENCGDIHARIDRLPQPNRVGRC